MKEFIQEKSVLAVVVLVALMINSVASKYYTLPSNAIGKNGKILLGDYAKDGQFPYQVSLLIQGANNCSLVERSCGGSIIATNWVLTSAFCVTPGPLFDTVYFVYLGAGSVYYKKSPQRDIFNTTAIYPHPDFNGDTLENDIAMLKTWGFDFSTKLVQPIPLVTSGTDMASYLGKYITVSGFGKFSIDGIASKKLLYTQLKVVECGDGTPDTSFCAVDEVGPVSAICDGDAGGPAVCILDGQATLIGVISYSDQKGCDAGPQGFTNVAQYIDWIQETMSSN
ncbi:collagenase-like [Lutzomyia longipalpis]|uniref:collagenase-like n=1 Tax=Lutzomyia longipalpis TaxID=7200 RepID=UPI0024834FB8|nr:collagenase-like [Lutzomyia longipalpis]